MHNEHCVWDRDMNVQPRHCNPGKDPDTGERVRYIDWQDYCLEDHRADPKVVGTVEFLRFIWEFQKVLRETHSPLTNPFGPPDNPDSKVVINRYHTFVVNGLPYSSCEEYWINEPDSSNEWRLVFGNYFNSRELRNNFSLFDERYIHLAEEAYKRVQKQFAADALIGIKE